MGADEDAPEVGATDARLKHQRSAHESPCEKWRPQPASTSSHAPTRSSAVRNSAWWGGRDGFLLLARIVLVVGGGSEDRFESASEPRGVVVQGHAPLSLRGWGRNPRSGPPGGIFAPLGSSSRGFPHPGSGCRHSFCAPLVRRGPSLVSTAVLGPSESWAGKASRDGRLTRDALALIEPGRAEIRPTTVPRKAQRRCLWRSAFARA